MAIPTPAELRDTAMEAAWAGGRRTLARFGTALTVETKADLSPVTIADRESEAEIRRVLAARYPRHTVVGEEEGETLGDEPVRWIVDPLDGTKSFIAGVPLYGVLIGVEVQQEVVAGVIYLPALDEMVAAARGEGCTWNGRPCRVSARARLDQALVVLTSEASARRRSGAWSRLVDASGRQRTWGDCYGYVLVATGRADVAVDPFMNVWDCAPLLPIVEEAGGRFTSWTGERTIRGGDAVASNGILHTDLLGILGQD